ncbi:hypothetical protein NPIL_282961 [Nephila pilipes]|uniref:Uncharacterized protein n=1 Tax=Nephila pilipes TaxID=299642 RepID=A0A8X6TMV6_NEPPI|nr:hypothetical protein NPIL_282961 [Nephila pilipes]
MLIGFRRRSSLKLRFRPDSRCLPRAPSEKMGDLTKTRQAAYSVRTLYFDRAREIFKEHEVERVKETRSTQCTTARDRFLLF